MSRHLDTLRTYTFTTAKHSPHCIFCPHLGDVPRLCLSEANEFILEMHLLLVILNLHREID